MSEISAAPRTSVEEYNFFVLRHTWRNFWLNAADGILYAMGMALAHPSTVLPGFINDCAELVPNLQDHKNTLVGLLGLIISVCFMMPQQLWAARMTEKRPLLKPLLIVVALFERLPWLVMGVMTALVAKGNPLLALYLFFAIVFSYQFILGVVSPVWQEAVAKMTPVNKRGLLFGVRESIGGILGVVTLFAAQAIVRRVAFPINYVWLFSGMFLFTTISWTALFFLKEAPHPFERKAKPLPDYFRDVWGVLATDRNFSRYFACRSFFSLAGVAGAYFFAMRAVAVLGESAALNLTIDMTYVVMLGRIISVLFGPIGDRYGHRLLLALANLITAAGIAVALTAQSVSGFYVAYLLATFGMMAFWCGHSNYILELAPLQKRPSYISLDNMSGLPFVWAPFLGGWLADRFGYALPFIIGIALALAGAVAFFTLAPDPRKALRKDLVS